jgi:hypothetical protein
MTRTTELAKLIKKQPWVYGLPDEAMNWSYAKRIAEAKYLLANSDTTYLSLDYVGEKVPHRSPLAGLSRF